MGLRKCWQKLLLKIPFMRKLLEYSDADDERKAEKKREERRQRDREHRGN